ncbi:toll/interleukin-1 receptor domain-containing protein [Sorangium sp. So ce388]|uniref:toll/interleukin-1 receptor domain-containing protein n=1 Tax=Sorangium sp. So ce388 TaxID=3133309 RepID=UPI003F5AF029
MTQWPSLPRNYRFPTSADELVERYRSGERYLRGAVLQRAVLEDVELDGADLAQCNFEDAKFYNSNLRGTNLTGAQFLRATLERVDLSGSMLTDTDFTGATLRHTIIDGCNCSGLGLDGTVFLGVSLGPMCEATTPVVHRGRSYPDYSSIIASVRSPRLDDFLVRTGMPEVFVTYMVSCARAVEESAFSLMRSTYICCGKPDEVFARRLYEALHKNGVTTFLFSEHAEPGKRIGRLVRDRINRYDRVVLVCSRASLNRKGVLFEIEETLAREARDGGVEYLIPIRLDNFVLTEWTPPDPGIARAVRDRVVADFEGVDDAMKFSAALRRLLAALRRQPFAYP